MNTEAARAIEAVLMAATEPVEPAELAQLLELPVAEVEGLCALLAAGCSGRGFVLVKVAGGYRFQTHPDMAPYVERYLLEGRHARLSSAALETLAVIAYKQPVTRSQLSAVRGVDVDGVMRNLLDRGYIVELDRDETAVGHPARYVTTALFLERLGLESLDKLPSLAELVPSAEAVEELEARLRESARPAPRPANRTRRRSRSRRPGDGQGQLIDVAGVASRTVDVDLAERNEPGQHQPDLDEPGLDQPGLDEADLDEADLDEADLIEPGRDRAQQNVAETN